MTCKARQPKTGFIDSLILQKKTGTLVQGHTGMQCRWASDHLRERERCGEMGLKLSNRPSPLNQQHVPGEGGLPGRRKTAHFHRRRLKEAGGAERASPLGPAHTLLRFPIRRRQTHGGDVTAHAVRKCVSCDDDEGCGGAGKWARGGRAAGVRTRAPGRAAGRVRCRLSPTQGHLGRP